jgi:hypothetical protein
MPHYDTSRYDPPAPVANVTIRDLTTGASVGDVFLLLDTGADVTLLPRAAVQRLGVTPVVGTTYEILAIDGTRSAAEAVDLDMIFLRKAYRGRYLLIDDEQGVLGRDVLASVALIFDGPGQEWSERNGGAKA